MEVKISPENWLKLPYNKRLDCVVKLFLIYCGKSRGYLTGNNKIHPDYYKVRQVFYKRNPDELSKIYEYLYALDKHEFIPMGEVYNRAEKFRREKISDLDKTKRKQIQVKNYKEYSIDDILSW